MTRRKMDYVQPVKPQPDEKRKGPQCRWPGPGEVLALYPAEPEVLWYRTHYVGDRTRPCLGEVCGCHRADVRVNTRLVGWILAWEKYGQLVLAAVTPNAMKYCKELQVEGLDLRTKKLTLTRIGQRPNGKVFAKVEERDVPADRFPPIPFSQRDQLLRVWFKADDDQAELAYTAEVLEYLGNRDPVIADQPDWPPQPGKKRR